MTATLDLGATLKSAYEAFNRGDYTAADAACETILAGAPENPDGWRLRARLRLVRDDAAGAAAALDAGLRATRDPLPLMEDRAELGIKTGETTLAVELSTELRRRAGDLVKYVHLHARALWSRGDHGLALPEFERAARHAPDVPEVQLSLARAYLHLNRLAEGRAALGTFLARRPNGAASALLAHCDLDPAAPAGALALAEHALVAAPGEPSLRFTVALLRTLAGDRAGAEPLLDVLRAPGYRPRWEGFEHLRAAGCARFVGLPVQVLDEALGAARGAGHVAEFGVFTGRSLRMIAARETGPVHGFDSFAGLPEDWTYNAPRGTYSTGGRRPELPANVELHVGEFEATLPAFAATAGPARLWHVDCDLYSATRCVLDALGATLQAGSVIVFDDLVGYPTWRDHEWRAWDEHARRAGIEYRWLCAALGAREAAVEILSLR